MTFSVSKFFPLVVVSALAVAGCDSDDDNGGDVIETTEISPDMRFFVTSVGIGDGANLGGLTGADAHCTSLAASASAVATEWRALSLIHI